MPRPGVAVVVGGSGGIGSVIARTLAQDGWNIALSYHSRRERAEAVAGDVKTRGQRASVHALDLADTDAAARFIADIMQEHGAIGTLVYAAGPLVRQTHLSRTDPAAMRAHLIKDTLGFFALVHAALPHLRASRGNVVACHSAAQYRWAPADGLSAVPKAAVTAIMTGVAKEEGRFGVRANGVAIGLIDAGQHHDLMARGDIDQTYLDAAARATPLRRVGQAQDVAQAVVFLADDARSGFVTGQAIHVDGGYSI